MTGESHFTYEKLFNLLRSEKSDLKLQKLPDSYYIDIVSYLVLKQKNLEAAKSDDLFSQEQVNAEHQLRNAQKIVQEIYDRREKKIMTLALNKSRTSSNIIDTSNLLREEQLLLRDMIDIMMQNRKSVIQTVLNGKSPELLPPAEDDDADIEMTPKAADAPEMDDGIDYVVKEDVPEFMGPDMNQYGPYEADSLIRVPEKIAQVLLKSGKITLVGDE
jgi:DNA replication initiation complex subunit (GINS family)